MHVSELHNGDIVRFRDWDDMLAQYGYSDDAGTTIEVPYHFVDGMRYLCGHTAIVHHAGVPVTLKANPEDPVSGLSRWTFSPEMLEFPYAEDDFPAGDECDLFDIFVSE